MTTALATVNSLTELNTVAAREREEAQKRVYSRAEALVGLLTANVGATDLIRTNFLRFLLDGPRDIDAECGYPTWLTPDHYKAMYDREGIARRVVECLPKETWSMDPEIFDDDSPEVSTPFEVAWKEFNKAYHALHHLQRIDVLSGIGQFGILLFGLNDKKSMSEPVDGFNDDGSVDPERVMEGMKILFMRPFSESVVFVRLRETDPGNPRFGLPKLYTIQFRDFPNWGVQAGELVHRDVHWSRVLHVADNRQESEVYGTPRMQYVYNRLYDIRKIFASAGEAFWKGGFPGFAFEVNPDVADQGVEMDKDSIRNEFQNYSMGLQRYMAIEGVTAKTLQPAITEPSATIEINLKAIAISLDIPSRKLFGAEEAKLASGEDTKTWNGRVANRQERYVNPWILDPFLMRMVHYGVLPVPKNLQYHWPDLNAPTDQDKAVTALTKTQALATYISGNVNAIVPPSIFLEHVMGFTSAEVEAMLEAAIADQEGGTPVTDSEESPDEGGFGNDPQRDDGNALDQPNLSRSTTVPPNAKPVESQFSNLPNLNGAGKKGRGKRR